MQKVHGIKLVSLDTTFKGHLISKCLFEVFVWTKLPTKILIISALKGPGQKLLKFSLVFWSKDIFKLTDLYKINLNTVPSKEIRRLKTPEP